MTAEKKKLGLISKLLIGIVAGALIGLFLPEVLVRILVTAVFILLFMADIVAKFLASKLPQWLMWLPRGLANLNLFHWFDSFTGGILPLTAVVFYVTVAAAFLFFTARILERRRWR